MPASPLSALKTLSPSTLSHAGYLAVAKTRAKALHALSLVITVPRPQLFIGEQSCYELCDMMINEGATNILIVTDAVLNKLGVPEKVTTYLEQKNISYHLFDGITPDPTFSVVEEGLSRSVENNCDAILALGGGSVIDASKIIAISQATGRKPKKLMGILKATECMPLYCIPTTAGTGSEATLGAVISDDKTHQKSLSIDPRMVPLASAVDPSIMQGMPPRITADTGIDVLTHALEAWMSATANSETDYYAASATRAVMQYLPVAYQNGSDLKAREQMGIAAHYGGIAFNKAGLGYVHGIAHQLGAFYGIPHGRANAIVLPYILDANRDVSKERLAALARKTGVVNPDQPQADDDDAADYLIAQVKRLIEEVNIDRTVDGINPADFKKIAKGAAKEVRDTYTVPQYFTTAQIVAILNKIKAASDSLSAQ
ncbi:iron-containing alcohol dehydrogenase [Psychrobacter sp. FDAARGOS_221]|uniref:iron-containing alcohol dehydrogenase n=1 Tax=Psychrobacter sp. FDAARGOS_221 TaxID=1975705 RepID=UPI000BB587F7|nr:iron-containing alcohol dehydrogenase [Psychrobacter sp. FDAARGOS_221]PNK60669.1 alcohol dehydrogenase [Psychrobacter sp. FDAARGOS_221]